MVETDVRDEYQFRAFHFVFSGSSVGSDCRVRVRGLVRPVWNRLLLVEVKFQMAFNFELKSLVRLGSTLSAKCIFSFSSNLKPLSTLRFRFRFSPGSGNLGHGEWGWRVNRGLVICSS